MIKRNQHGQRFADLADDAYIRLKHLLSQQIVPFSASTLWRKCRKNEFPRPTKMSEGITAWRVGDVREYLKAVSGNGQGGCL